MTRTLQGMGSRALGRVDAVINRLYGSRYNPLYQSGTIVVALFLVLLVTGLYLVIFYRIGAPWASVLGITEQVWFGRWIRGLHRFASDGVILAALVHAVRMFVQGRSWGARAPAWISGVVLLGVLMVCGWTGYVMVWDVQAQVLAQEGARFLDVVPLFSEPISRAFVGERPLPSAFFFLNLFAHIALPIGVGMLIWLHINRVARAALLPPRGLLWGTVGGLIALAVIWPVPMGAEANLFRLPAHVSLDVIYSGWLPLTRRMTPAMVWLAGLLLVAGAVLVPVWTRPRESVRPPKSFVNERVCTGCEQCMLDCPYGAITMISRSDGRDGFVAHVDPDLCVSCGICAGSCAPMGVGPAGRTGRDQLDAVRSFLSERKPGARDVVVIGCKWSAAGSGGAGALQFPVACVGNLHTSVVELLVRSGAGGVLIASCPARDCRGREGAVWLEQRLHHGREAELQERVDRRRVRTVEASSAEGALLTAALRGFRSEITALADAALVDDDIDVMALCKQSQETAAAGVGT